MEANFFYFIKNFLYSPWKVFVFSFLFSLVILLFDGSFFSLWSLRHNYKVIEQNIKKIKKENLILTKEIKNAQKLDYIEFEARKLFSLVKKDEIYFVFPKNK